MKHQSIHVIQRVEALELFYSTDLVYLKKENTFNLGES